MVALLARKENLSLRKNNVCLCFSDGRTCAIRDVKKKDFGLTQDIRWEVKEIRYCDTVLYAYLVGVKLHRK